MKVKFVSGRKTRNSKRRKLVNQPAAGEGVIGKSPPKVSKKKGGTSGVAGHMIAAGALAQTVLDRATRESKAVGADGDLKENDIDFVTDEQVYDQFYQSFHDDDGNEGGESKGGDIYETNATIADLDAARVVKELGSKNTTEKSVTSNGISDPALSHSNLEMQGGDSDGDFVERFGNASPIRNAHDITLEELEANTSDSFQHSQVPTPPHVPSDGRPSLPEEKDIDATRNLRYGGDPGGNPGGGGDPGGSPGGGGRPAGAGERKAGDPDRDPDRDPDPDRNPNPNDPGGGGNRDNLEGIANAAPKTTPFNFTQGYTDEKRLPGMAQSRDINIGFDEKMDKLKREQAAQAAQQGAPAMMTPQLRDLSARTKFPFRIIHHAAVEKFLLTVDFPSFMKFVRDHHPDLIRTAATLDIPGTELIQNSKSLLVFWGDKIGIKKLKYSSNSKLKDISDEYQEILMCVMGLVISAAVTPMLSNRGQTHIANTTREVDQVAQANANVGSNSTLANATMQNTGPTASWEQDMRSLSKMFPTGKNQQTLLFS